MRVLLVEDDNSIAEPLGSGLVRYGFEVDRACTGQDALDAPPHDVVLLDLGLPDIDGIDVCRQLRARSAVPIIVITARAAEVDRVLGLELGADDYVVKPFGFRELVARIRAVSRRAQALPEPVGLQHLGSMELDRRERRVRVDGTDLVLTAKEFDLLALLAEDPCAVLPRERILEHVWDQHWFGPAKTLDVHVAALRRKLGDPGWIETVRGVGFRLVTR
jgi:DNA-binding response OmpR family regulator